MFNVVEKFVSINGEGIHAGELAVFIRFHKCNLKCSYCDTMWANEEDAKFEVMTTNDILDYLDKLDIERVTLTGGEPLMQDGISELLIALSDSSYKIEIETNGSIDLRPFKDLSLMGVSFTMDYKLPSSLMESKMLFSNLDTLNYSDVIKFVAGTYQDLEKFRIVTNENDLLDKTQVILSPSFMDLKPRDLVEYIIKHNMNGVKMQLQMHKYIWSPETMGV
ncbi:MAG: putative 7-carboxy-7-deazaguanine synthase QueE [Acidaminobacteraceae bacterium]